MRQAGILAAACLYALDNNMTRLPEDHVNAKALAEKLDGAKGVIIDMKTVQTNIVIFRTGPNAPDAATVVAKAREHGVLVNPFAARTVRATTHLDVTREQCAKAGEVLARIVAGG